MTENPMRFESDPTALVALARALLTIHPDRSLVLIALGGTGQVKVTLRVDLSDDPHEQSGSAAHLVSIFLANDVSSVVVMTFHPQRLAAYGHRAAMSAALRTAGLPTLAALHVDDEQITTDDGETHPLPTGEQIDAARAVVGTEPPMDRSERIASMAPTGDDEVTAQVGRLEKVTADPQTAAGDLDALCCLHLSTGQIAAADAGRYLLNIAQVAYRDAFTVAIASPEAMANARDVLTDLARRAPRGYRADAYALAAVAYYLRGDGITAMAAVDQAHAADPHHTLARLIGIALQRGVEPGTIRQLLVTHTDEN